MLIFGNRNSAFKSTCRGQEINGDTAKKAVSTKHG